MSDFENNRIWANDISEKLEHINEDEIIIYFQKLESKWKLEEKVENSFSNISKNFNISCLNDIDANFIETEKNKIIWEITGVYNKFKNLIDLYSDDYNHYLLRWEKLFETIYYSERIIRTFYLLDRIKEDKYNYSLNEDTSGLYKFVPINYEKNTSYQNLLLFILQDLSENDFAKYNDSLYRKIYSKEGYETFAWEPYMKIKNYIMNKCKKNMKFDQWKNMTDKAGNLKQAVEYLLECPDEELLQLEKDRHIFSFKNGVFITKINKGDDKNPHWGTLFVPYNQKSEYLNSKTVASRYFNLDFNDFPNINEDNWFDILNECPNFKKILDYQEFPKEVQFWLCIFIGKMGYDIGEMENWQAIMYLLGMGGAGKSTILNKNYSKIL